MTFPKAFRERHKPPPASLVLLRTFSQLPRSMRCSLLRPPDTGPETEEDVVEHSADTPSLKSDSHALWHDDRSGTVQPRLSELPDLFMSKFLDNEIIQIAARLVNSLQMCNSWSLYWFDT